MRIAVALAMLALASPASAGPGGKLGGSFTASWQTGDWNGQVSMALDPGDAARDAAVRKIKSGQPVRPGYVLHGGRARTRARERGGCELRLWQRRRQHEPPPHHIRRRERSRHAVLREPPRT